MTAVSAPRYRTLRQWAEALLDGYEGDDYPPAAVPLAHRLMRARHAAWRRRIDAAGRPYNTASAEDKRSRRAHLDESFLQFVDRYGAERPVQCWFELVGVGRLRADRSASYAYSTQYRRMKQRLAAQGVRLIEETRELMNADGRRGRMRFVVGYARNEP